MTFKIDYLYSEKIVIFTKVIILSAGTGTRLKLNLPKSLVQVNNKKMVDIQIGILNSIGIDMDKITVVTGYKSNLFSQN